MSTKLLGYNIFNETKEVLLETIKNYKKINIISGNPEVLYNGIKSQALFSYFNKKDSIIIPDGIGIIIAARLVKHPVKEKIPGIEVMEEILKYSEKLNKSVYFLGAEDGILSECIKKIKIKFPELNIKGFHNGFFDLENCEPLINEITEVKPYAIFVAMGSPRQDLFIQRFIDILPCNVFMGVGGSFDVFSGKVRRAPRWMITLGLEWLYRVYKEPYRVKRLIAIPKFILLVLKDNYFTKKGVKENFK